MKMSTVFKDSKKIKLGYSLLKSTFFFPFEIHLRIKLKNGMTSGVVNNLE